MKLLRIILIVPLLFSCDFISIQKTVNSDETQAKLKKAEKWSFLEDVVYWDNALIDSSLNLIEIPQFEEQQVNKYLEDYRYQAKEYILAIQSDSVDYIIEVEERWSKMGASVDSLKNFIQPDETEQFTDVMNDIARILRVGSEK
jgi:hypothetical protein